MAQWEKKEETAEMTKVAAATKTPTTLTLCVNNCGLPGDSTTKNMCNSCFKASIALKEALPSCSGQEKARSEPILDRILTDRVVEEAKVTEEDAVVVVVEEEKVKVVNRCTGCRRKVGLTGFRCRCGGLFCAEHRYSDRHNCGFDYKAAGREAIARENPVFKAAKIVRF